MGSPPARPTAISMAGRPTAGDSTAEVYSEVGSASSPLGVWSTRGHDRHQARCPFYSAAVSLSSALGRFGSSLGVLSPRQQARKQAQGPVYSRAGSEAVSEIGSTCSPLDSSGAVPAFCSLGRLSKFQIEAVPRTRGSDHHRSRRCSLVGLAGVGLDDLPAVGLAVEFIDMPDLGLSNASWAAVDLSAVDLAVDLANVVQERGKKMEGRCDEGLGTGGRTGRAAA